MSNVFNKQSLLIYKLDTGLDLTAASVKKILYKKPDGSKGGWDASVEGTKLVYNFNDTDINVSGEWEFQAYVEIGGKKGYGDVVTEHFKLNLS